MSHLILIRHGQSEWNLQNKFTGWVDVDLTPKGKLEACKSGELIKGFSLALIIGVIIGTYSSIYVVANMLMSLTLTQDDLAIPEPEGADFDGMP